MHLSSISAVIEAANSKLALFLRTKEEEEALLRSKVTRKSRLKGEVAWSRWALQPDFLAPSPMVDRPRTATGATSFHFAYETIRKVAVPIGSNGEPISGPMAALSKPICDYAKYIERDGAAEISAPGQAHAAYIERPGASEWHVPEEENEQTEVRLLGPLERVAGKASIFTNISEDPEERIEFWRAVVARESNPRIHAIFLKPWASPNWWKALPETEELDEDFKQHALRVAEQYKQFRDRQGPERDEEEKFKAEPFVCSAEKAGKLIEQAEMMPWLDQAAHPLWFKSGRGGHIQYRIVAELPHEITPEARAEIVGKFCNHIANLEEREGADGEVKKVGMMYTAVIHAPDPHNDNRNFHAHIVAHDRPATITLDENGERVWDFAATVEYITPRRQRRTKYRYPVQKKIREVNSRDFIPNLREKFAQITNEVLREQGIKRRLDHRTYKEMKIDRTPTKHLGNKAAALASIGVPTSLGQRNAVSIWTDAERAITREVGLFSDRAASEQNRLQAIGHLALQVDPDGPETNQFFQLLGSRQRLIERIGSTRSSLMMFDLNEAKAKSGAVRAIRTCETYLAEIAAGTADQTTKDCRDQIEDRLTAGRSHIEKIDAALAPHREALKIAADALQADEQKYQQDASELHARVPYLRLIISHGAPLRTPEPAAPSLSAAEPDLAPAAEPILRVCDAANVIATDAPSLSIPAYPEPPTMEGQRIMEPTVKAPPVPLEDHARQAGDQGRQPVEEKTTDARWEANGRLDPVAPGTPERIKSAAAPDETETLARVEGNRAAEQPRECHRRSDASTSVQAEVSQEPEVNISRDQPVRRRSAMQVSPAVEGASQRQAGGSPDPSRRVRADGRTAARATPEGTASGTARSTDLSNRDERAGDGARGTETMVENESGRASSDEPSAGAKARDGAKATASSLAAWELIFRKIKARKLLISRDPDSGILSVAHLSDEEHEVLHGQGLTRRSQGRLQAYFDVQEKEVRRVLAWLRTHGPNPGMLILMGREARLSEDADMYIRKLFHGWGEHPRIREALSAEEVRRRGLSVQPKTVSSSVAGRAIGELSGTPVSPPENADATGSGSSDADKELKDLQDQLEALKASLGR